MKNKYGQINIVLQNNQPIKNNEANNNYNNISPFTLIDEEFSSFIGLNKMKRTVKEIYATIIVNEKRKSIGLNSPKQVLHMLFKGNPGTGKTTVARKLSKLYYDMNILSKGHFIEVERADLVGEYIGQTAQKTRAMIQKAMGGVLFIDEAYSLARGGEKDFGKEAIDTLVKQMEDYHNDFVLVLAGYPREMNQFLSLNPGLQSRFPFIINFNDFNIDELLEIARQMLYKRDYKLTKEAEWKLRTHLIKKMNRVDYHFSNARYVRNTIENAIRMHAVRVLSNKNFSQEDLMELSAYDLQFNE